MRNIIFTLCLLFLSLSIVFSQNQSSNFVNFEHDSDIISLESAKVLEALITKSDKTSYQEFTIVGHTDQDGSHTYNMDLARRRANAVKTFLNQKGIKANLMYIDWKGEEELLFSDNSNTSKTKNRRVEIITQNHNFDEVDDILTAAHQVDEQIYQINSTKPQTLIANHGTIINIPTNAFEYADGSGPVTEKVNITIKEAFDLTDFVSEELFTSSKGAMLETGGMLYINATARGKEVQLSEGSELSVQYPFQEVKPNMELFYGEADDMGALDWTPTQQMINPIDPNIFYQNVDIDLDKILNYDFGKLVKPVLAEPDIPYKPRIQRKPYPPVKPEGAFPHEYEKYEQKYKNYEIALEEYYKNIPIIEEKLDKWQQEVTRRVFLVQGFKNAMEDFLGKIQAIVAIKKIEKMKGKMSKAAIFSFLDNSMSSHINYKYDEKQLYRKVLGRYTGEVLRDRDISYKRRGVSELNVRQAVSSELNKLISNYRIKAIEEGYAQNGELDERSFSHYVTNISRLGWINCDRFLRYPEQDMMNFEFVANDNDVNYYLIFEDIRSILKARHFGKIVKFGRVPLNQKVNLIAVKLEGNEPHLAKINFSTGEDSNDVSLDFRPSSLQEIRAELNALDSRAE